MIGPAALKGLDRVSLAVDNLEAARKSFLALGFTLSARSRHLGRGTGAYRIALPGLADDGVHLELVAQIDASEPDPALQARLKHHGEGLLALTLKAQDMNAAEAEARATLSDPARDSLRPEIRTSIDHDGGQTKADFTLLTLLDGLGKRPVLQASAHATPELIYQNRWMHHLNGALAVREVHVRSDSLVDDIYAAAPFCAPAQNAAQDRQVAARMDGDRVARLVLYSDAAWAGMYGEGDPHTAGLVFECDNAIEAKSHLQAVGLEPEFVNSRLNGYRVPIAHSHGIWMTFVSA